MLWAVSKLLRTDSNGGLAFVNTVMGIPLYKSREFLDRLETISLQ
jgi:hypothetical protein